MPIHDWTRVSAGLFHDFHQRWTGVIADALNEKYLPDGYSALVEYRSNKREPDVLTIEASYSHGPDEGGLAIADPPQTRFKARLSSDNEMYARKANSIEVRDQYGEVVAIIEVVSPGNKSSQESFREFLDKSTLFLNGGIHLLVVDLFPPTPRDPHGIHGAIWNEYPTEEYEQPDDKPLTLVSYSAGTELKAFIEPLAVGDNLPDEPLFIAPERHVLIPLESTYETTWTRTARLTKQAFKD